MAERVSDARATIVKAALQEARQRGDRRVGTDHLLLGLLHAPHSVAAQALGIDLDGARAALDALDQQALAAIGIDAAGFAPAGIVPARKRPPLTSAARSVLHRATQEWAKNRREARRPTGAHMLLALLACERPDPAAEVMAHLGIDRAAVRASLAASRT
jgi:ATP-dependent Clp protease ATP-binding subunit ClpA